MIASVHRRAVGTCWRRAQAVARALVAAAGARAVAARLADLEARLPAAGATKCAGFRFWEAWRRGCARAESAAELAPQARRPAASRRRQGPCVVGQARNAQGVAWPYLQHLPGSLQLAFREHAEGSGFGQTVWTRLQRVARKVLAPSPRKNSLYRPSLVLSPAGSWAGSQCLALCW